MTLAALAFLGQLADGLGYQLVAGRAGEINPFAVPLGPYLLAVKVGAGLVLAIGSLALVRRGRGRLVAWFAVVGWLGALSEVAA